MEGVMPKRVELKCRDMPMDYDDSEFNIHNVELAEEGSSNISPVLRPYDYEDGGNLRFDSLVENEVFLGITGQEDNQWIEEYSRGTNSSVVESRHANAWSEATSPESVEMLLKSVGQGALVTESSDELGCLATNMDPNLKQDDENNRARETMVANKEEEGALANETLVTSDEPGSLSIYKDPILKQDDENREEGALATETTVTSKEEGVWATEDLEAIDEPCSSSIDMDPILMQDDENNHAQEAIVTNKEEEGVLATEELDASDEPGSLTINMDPNLKQDVENNQAQETLVTNKKEEEALATQELDVIVEHGSLSINTELFLKQDDENNQAEEAAVSNKEEAGTFATEELDVSDEPDSLTINMDPNLLQVDRNNNVQEATVTNKEVGPLVTEVLDATDDPGRLTINMDPDSKQHDGNKYAHEVIITKKEEEGTLTTAELDVSDEPRSLTINMDPDLKEDDGNKHAQEAMLTNEEAGVLVSEELDASDDSGDLATNMVPILKQDDGNNYAHEAMVTNEEVGAFVTEELDASDHSGYLATNVYPILKQDDGNNVAVIINKTEDHFSGCNASFDHQKVIVMVTEDSQGVAKVSGVELDSDVLANKCDLLEEREEGASDESGSLALNKDLNLLQDDENNHAHEEVIVNKPHDHFFSSNASFKFQKDDVATNEDSQEEVKVSGIELDSNFLAKKCELAVELSEKLDGICDEVNRVARIVAVESSENKLQEDLSTSNIESVNMDTNKEFNLKTCPSSNETKCITKNMDNPIGSHTGVETCTNSVEDPLNVESLDKPPFEVDIPVDEELMPGGSCNLLLAPACAEVSHDSKCAVAAFPMAHELINDLMDKDLPSVADEDDDKTKSENLASIQSNVCSPLKVSDVQSSYAEESEKPESVFDASEMGEGSRITDMGTNMTKTCSSAELLAGNTDLVATPKAHSGTLNKDQSPASKLPGSVQQQVNDEIQSSEEDGGTCIDHDVTFREEGNKRVALDMDIEALDGPKNVESISYVEGRKSQGSEADITVLVEPGNAATDYIDAKSSPIFWEIGSVGVDNKKKEEGYISKGGTCENESIKAASSMVDCATLSLVETCASPDSAGEVVHGTSVENTNAILNELAQEANPDGLGGCSTPLSIDPIPCDSPAKVGDNVEAGDGIQESFSGHHVIMSSEQHASTDVVLTSEYDDSYRRHEDDSSVLIDKLQSDSPLLKTVNTELSQSTNIKPGEGVINENTSLPKSTKMLQGKEQYIPSNSDMKIDRSFTFEVSATAGLEETDKALQLFPASQACNLSMNMEVPCIESSSSTLDPRTPNEATVVTPQTLGSGTILVGSEERKRRRKSVGKESVKKGKETTPIQSGRRKKASPLLVTPSPPTTSAATDHVIQFQELRPNKKVECSATKPTAISNLPDLNNATCIFHQPFTNNQQFQLRAQILVYGSLISGMPPEEPHMIAAFGQSDAGRKTWEAAWYAYVERVHGQKSKANTPATPQPQSDLKDVGDRSSTPAALSPLISVSSPLWNMSTPSYVGIQSRSPAFQQSFTPIHPSTYQTPPNPLWLSQSHPFLGQWGVASSPALATHRFSGLPITEAVKLTPVKVSGIGPHAYSMPVVDSSVLSSGESKSRKRKKLAASISSVPSHVIMTPPVAHLVPHNCIPPLVENQTDSVTAPIVTGVFSTPVTVSTPPGRFLSVHDHHRLEDKAVGNAEDLLKKVDEGNMQEADVNATRTCLPSSDSRSIRRTKVTTSPAVNPTPVSTPASASVSYLPQVLGSEISLLSQNQTISATTPVFCTSLPTSIVMSTPVASTSGSSPTGRFLAVEETLSKVKESTLLAENAALLAAAEVSNCHDVWSRLDSQNSSHVVSDAEAKLMSSIAAAAAVAKMASAAAKIASNIAEQTKFMADEVSLSSKSENFNHISHPYVVNKSTAASSLKSVDKKTNNHPNSIISAAREAARRRIEAASAASKHAENLDAIVKAAELAAEAVSRVGKIVAMHDPSALRKLAEAGPEGFWNLSQLAYAQLQGGEVSGLHLNGNNPPVNLAHNQIMMVIDDSSVTCNEKNTSTSKVSDLSKAVGVSTKTNTGSPRTYVVGRNSPRITSAIWEENNIKEGCLVEIYKEDGKYKGAWLAANVLSLKDEKALVCYTGIQSSDGGLEKVKEWVSFEVEDGEAVPRIRSAHPMTTMLFEGARKRRRTAVIDYSWSKGDRVDVWMQDCWREGVVMEPNKNDVTSLTVQFSAQGETSAVRSWHVRPTLMWKDRKWIEWNGNRDSEGDMPKEKRMKRGSPDALNDKRKDKLPIIVEPGRHEEQGTLLPLLSAHESRFNFGKTTTKHSSNLRTIKERAGVVFGVPKPGKKQKFMDVSSQYVADRTNKNNMTNGSFKFSKPPGVRVLKSDLTENQVTETKPRLKSRKPPVPVFRTMNSRDSERTDVDSVENSSSRQNQTHIGSSSSNKSRDPAKGLASKKGFTFTSKPKSEPFNRGKLQLAPKIEVKDTSDSQVNEPRRSNRKIQPTSRLLEGIQSSITISKIPSVSHSGQRKVIPKGNTSHG